MVLNSIVVVELLSKTKSPSIVNVPILLPGAKVPPVEVTLPPIVAPPPNVPPLTDTLFAIIVVPLSAARPAYKIPSDTVTSPDKSFCPLNINVPVPDFVKPPDPLNLPE